ncbi:unnamed protein product [Rhizophagus irregularis]|nr:unnamed protein product [Rhizophagus irregularis]CAB4417781.1 unnamed protein product [Rhizophagus irregularis]
MGLQITKCCFCIPLKAGVIIISLFWLFAALFLIIFRVLSLKLYMQDKELREVSEEYSITFTSVIIMIVLNAFVTLGTAFGLYAVIFSKKYRMLKLYSTFGLIMTVIEVIIGIAVIINSIVFGCAKGKNSYLCRLAPYEIVFEVLLTVYFSLIISAYACRKKEKEAAAVRNLNESSDQTNHNFVVV